MSKEFFCHQAVVRGLQKLLLWGTSGRESREAGRFGAFSWVTGSPSEAWTEKQQEVGSVTPWWPRAGSGGSEFIPFADRSPPSGCLPPQTDAMCCAFCLPEAPPRGLPLQSHLLGSDTRCLVSLLARLCPCACWIGAPVWGLRESPCLTAPAHWWL